MIGKRGCQSKILFITVLSIFFFIMIIIPSVHVLEIKNIKKEEILFQEKIFPGYVFATKINHSVQLTPVFEFYKIDEEYNILLTKTIIKDLGWGMPSTPEGKLSYQNGEIVIENISRKMPGFIFRVSYITKPELILRGRAYDLRFLVDDSSTLEIKNKKKSIVSRFYYFLIEKQ
jgi:hypothetical protein